MWFIGVEVEQETSAPPPKKNPGSALVMSVNEKWKNQIMWEILIVETLCCHLKLGRNE